MSKSPRHSPQSFRGRRVVLALAMIVLLGMDPSSLAAGPKTSAKSAVAKPLGIGREVTPAEIAGWDIDIRPDGQGLPPGKGTVKQGEAIYMQQCAACHGE